MMFRILVEDLKDSGRRPVPRLPGANGCLPDLHAVAIDQRCLIIQIDHDQNRPHKQCTDVLQDPRRARKRETWE